MGYDVSYHPVDVDLIRSRVVTYIRGQRDINDLVADAVRLAKVRFRANAWGLGLWHLHKETREAASPAVRVPDSFDSDLHIWGRPFFITGATPEEVSEGIDRYTAATAETVDDVAREML